VAAKLPDLPDDIEELKQLVLASRAEVEHLKLVIAKLKRLQFGRASEKLDREIDQLELRLEELSVAATPAAVLASVDKPAAKAPVRRALPAHLPRQEQVHQPAPCCPDCGCAMRKIGEDISEWSATIILTGVLPHGGMLPLLGRVYFRICRARAAEVVPSAGQFPQRPQDQILRFLCTPLLDPALQGSQLRLGCIGVRHHYRKASHHLIEPPRVFRRAPGLSQAAIGN
jgi:hypothetical protein